MNEYDAEYWKHGVNVTVGQLCDYLKEHIPPDAVFHVCGDSQVYLHFSPKGNAFSVDHDSLSDLPEYEGCEAGELGHEQTVRILPYLDRQTKHRKAGKEHTIYVPKCTYCKGSLHRNEVSGQEGAG